MKAWIMDRTRVAVLVPVGDARFTGWQKLLGAPSVRYFAPGGSEFARQWNLRRKSNARVYLRLRRCLAGSGDGVVEVKSDRLSFSQRRAA